MAEHRIVRVHTWLENALRVLAVCVVHVYVCVPMCATPVVVIATAALCPSFRLDPSVAVTSGIAGTNASIFIRRPITPTTHTHTHTHTHT